MAGTLLAVASVAGAVAARVADRPVEHDLAVAAHAQLQRRVDAAAVEVDAPPARSLDGLSSSPTAAGSPPAPIVVIDARSRRHMDAAQRVGDERKPWNRGHGGGPEGTLSHVSQFELEQFEQSGGRLRVLGRWSDVRGMRFMRPTLTVGDRRVLAVLDHKPWMPEEGQTWIAEFPWEGDVADIDTTLAELAVAPSVAVALSSPGVPVEPLGPPEPDPLALEEERRHRLESEISFLREQIDVLTKRLAETESERDAARARRSPPTTARRRRAPSCAPRSTRHAPSATTRASGSRRARAPRGRRGRLRQRPHRARRRPARAVPRPRRPRRAPRSSFPTSRRAAPSSCPRRRPRPIRREEPAPFVKSLEVWIPRFALAVFALCVLLLVIGAVKIF